MDKQNETNSSTNGDTNKATEAKEVTNKDLFLYFFFGATTLILKGLSLTSLFSKAIGVTNNQVPHAGPAFAIGALLGKVLVTTVYTMLRPKIRVGTKYSSSGPWTSFDVHSSPPSKLAVRFTCKGIGCWFNGRYNHASNLLCIWQSNLSSLILHFQIC